MTSDMHIPRGPGGVCFPDSLTCASTASAPGKRVQELRQLVPCGVWWWWKLLLCILFGPPINSGRPPSAEEKGRLQLRLAYLSQVLSYENPNYKPPGNLEGFYHLFTSHLCKSGQDPVGAYHREMALG